MTFGMEFVVAVALAVMGIGWAEERNRRVRQDVAGARDAGVPVD